MTTGGEISDDIGGSINRLQAQRDTAVERSVDLHRSGGSEEAVLAETAVAVGAAKALELLTGESWEAQMERREAGAVTSAAPAPTAEPRRWGRRNRNVPG
jgi:hypothetical protein